MRQFCEKLSPPPIQLLFGSFQIDQYHSRTRSSPHSSRQFQTISPQRSANQRTARGSPKGRSNLAKVTIGTAPTDSTASMYDRNSSQSVSGSRAFLSNRKMRMISVRISLSRSQIPSRSGPHAKCHQLSVSLTP